jgi:hypothetical protein
MEMITIVEVRTPIENPASQGSSVESDLAFVGSCRDKAMAFVAGHPNYRSDGHHWCWYVYDVVLDDPKTMPHNSIVVGRDGRTYTSQAEAWEAFSSEPTPQR